MRESLKGAVAVGTAALLWGTWKIWLRGPALDAAAQGAFVLAGGGIIGSGIALVRRRSWPGVPGWAWGFMAALGVAEALNCLLYFRAISEGDIATGVVAHYLAPVLVAAASPLVREPMGRRAPWAAGVAFIATTALVGFGSAGPGTRAAAIEGAGSAVFYAAGIFLSKRISRFFGPWELVGFHDLVAAGVLLLFARTTIRSAGQEEILWLVGGTLVATVTASAIYFYGLARVPAARAGILAYIEPVGATIVGTLLLHEPLTAAKILAMAVVITAGVAVATEPVPAVARAADEP